MRLPVFRMRSPAQHGLSFSAVLALLAACFAVLGPVFVKDVAGLGMLTSLIVGLWTFVSVRIGGWLARVIGCRDHGVATAVIGAIICVAGPSTLLYLSERDANTELALAGFGIMFVVVVVAALFLMYALLFLLLVKFNASASVNSQTR
jgi:hypothetical protein